MNPNLSQISNPPAEAPVQGVGCGALVSAPFFRAGDVVKHGPTGEEWVLANDQDGNDVSPCGWPRCLGYATDCTLVRAATDEVRMAMLSRWADKQTDYRDGPDHRVSTAIRQLSANAKAEQRRTGDTA